MKDKMNFIRSTTRADIVIIREYQRELEKEVKAEIRNELVIVHHITKINVLKEALRVKLKTRNQLIKESQC